jgi:serine/threonine-protein kinase haspin
MRSIISSDENSAVWADYRPATNVLWLHYLANKLLYAKQLPTPVTRLSARNQSKQSTGQKKGPERSFSIILDGEDKDAYEGLLNIYNRLNPKNTDSLGSAADVLKMGKENGWVG